MPFNIKFGIARKFLLASLALAIVPLLVAGWLEARSISRLGAELAAESGRTINDRTRRTLEQTTRHYADIINRQTRTIELLARLQAKRTATSLLNGHESPTNERHVLWANISSDQAAEQLLDAVPGFEYFGISKDGPFKKLIVSPKHQSVYSAEQPLSDELKDSAARLMRLTPYYLDVQRHHRDLFYWQYVALENGLVATFPGHRDYPGDFDARQRRWYQAQKAARQLSWSPPHTDAATGLAMVNVTMPIMDSLGQFAGVSGMDINLSGLLKTLQLPLKSEYDSRVMLSVLSDDTQSRKRKIIIVAQSEQGETKNNWRDTPELQTLELDVESDLQRIIDDTRTGRNGYIRTRWRGEDYFCLYEPLNANSSILLMFVPTDNLINPAIQNARHALTSTERYIRTLLPFAALLVVSIIALALLSSRRFVKPIEELVRAIKRVGDGDLETRVDIKTGDELEQLGDAFNAVIPQLREHTKIQEELSVARAVQQRLLPYESPEFAGIEIYGHTLYADQTGGDYYDFLDLNAHTKPTVGIVLGDVAGHGVAAAFMMATVRALLHGVANSLESPAAVLQHINTNLANDLHAGQFMTLFFLLFEAERRTLRWADAGHDPAIVYHPSNDSFSELSGNDIPLGVDSDWQYRDDRELILEPGDVVLLGTDGIWETKSPAGEQFGKERLRNILRNEHARTVGDICNAVLKAIDEFRDGLEQRDDVSIVAFRAVSKKSD